MLPLHVVAAIDAMPLRLLPCHYAATFSYSAIIIARLLMLKLSLIRHAATVTLLFSHDTPPLSRYAALMPPPCTPLRLMPAPAVIDAFVIIAAGVVCCMMPYAVAMPYCLCHATILLMLALRYYYASADTTPLLLIYLRLFTLRYVYTCHTRFAAAAAVSPCALRHAFMLLLLLPLI